MLSLVSAVKRGDITSTLWSLDHSKVILGQRNTTLGLLFLWDTEARAMVAQRPGKVCAVKLVIHERQKAVNGGSIQP